MSYASTLYFGIIIYLTLFINTIYYTIDYTSNRGRGCGELYVYIILIGIYRYYDSNTFLHLSSSSISIFAGQLMERLGDIMYVIWRMRQSRLVGDMANSSILPLLYSFGRTNMILLNIYHIENVHVTRVDNKLGPNSLLVLYPVQSYRRPFAHRPHTTLCIICRKSYKICIFLNRCWKVIVTWE